MIVRLLVGLLALALVTVPAQAAVRNDGASTQHLAGPAVSSPTSGAVTLIQWFKLNANPGVSKIYMSYHNNTDGGTLHRIVVSSDSADSSSVNFSTVIGGTPEDFELAVHTATVGTWFCYAIVRNGSDIRLYVGSESNGMALVSTLSSPSLQAQGAVYRWTATGNSGANLTPDSSIERFKMYNRELNLSEIEAERVSLTPSSTTNLWTYNPFTTAGSYGATDGSNQWTFSEQGGTGFTTVSGPSPSGGSNPCALVGGCLLNPDSRRGLVR